MKLLCTYTPLSLCSVQVLGGSVDGTVRQFDVRMGMMFSDTLHESVTGIAVSHDGNCVLASCLDHSMKLLDKASGELLATYTGETAHHSFTVPPAPQSFLPGAAVLACMHPCRLAWCLQCHVWTTQSYSLQQWATHDMSPFVFSL